MADMRYDSIDLHNGLYSSLASCDQAIKQLAIRGKEKAEASAAYRIALAEKELELRCGEDKLPASMIADVARGDRSVALLYVKRECADAIYEATREEIMLRKREADVYREQISREYAQAGMRAL